MISLPHRHTHRHIQPGSLGALCVGPSPEPRQQGALHLAEDGAAPVRTWRVPGRPTVAGFPHSIAPPEGPAMNQRDRRLLSQRLQKMALALAPDLPQGGLNPPATAAEPWKPTWLWISGSCPAWKRQRSRPVAASTA